MSPADVSAPFPFSSLVLEDVPPEAEVFDRILEGSDGMAGFVFGYCVASPSRSTEPVRYLLLFHRKPYSAGRILPDAGLAPTTLREFFIALARDPRQRLTFFSADPILVKSILVIQDCRPETSGSAEFIRVEEQVVQLLEGRKDALLALLRDGHYHFVFVKGGKVVKAYFYDQVLQSGGGLDWMDLFRRIASYRSRGESVRLQVYEQLTTAPAIDYLEGQPAYHGGVFGYYTRPMPELVVRDQTRTLKRVSVDRVPFVVGRSEECSLALSDPGISRRHATIEEVGGRFVLRDLGSTNGIFVNGHFTREFALQDGDTITLGSHTIQVVLPRSPAEDVRLVEQVAGDATMAMDRKARVKVSCPRCQTAGSLDAARLYGSREVRIRCPKCRHLFDAGALRSGPA